MLNHIINLAIAYSEPRDYGALAWVVGKWIMAAIAVALLVALVQHTIVFVREQTRYAVERFGKYDRELEPGIHFLWPIIERARWISMKVHMLSVTVETMTKDKTFVKIPVVIQYRVAEGRVYDALYKLRNSTAQMKTYVFDVVRARIPKIELDAVFEEKEELAAVLNTTLGKKMREYGFEILDVLVNDIDPDPNVKNAMNRINVAKRERVAAGEEGEAEKIRVIKRAEAQAAADRLSGVGIAAQRIEIINGLKESVDKFTEALPDSSVNDVMALVLATQYFDTLKDLGNGEQSKVLFMPSGPGALENVMAEIRTGIISGNLAGGK